jgi:putative transposase
MAIDKKLIDQLLSDYKKPEDLIGENGLLKELTKAILERALEAEMTDHLGYEKHDPAGHHRGEHAQRKRPQEAEGRLRRAATGDAPRPLRARSCWKSL